MPFASRQQALLEACAEDGIAPVLVFSMGSCFGMNGVAQGHMAFLCGWDAVDSPSCLMLRAGQPPVLFVVHHRMRMMALQRLTSLEVCWVDQADLPTALERTVREGGESGRLGLVGWQELPAGLWSELDCRLAGLERRNVDHLVAALRAVPDRHQLERQLVAAAICDRLFERLGSMRVVGRPTYAIKAELECLARTEGCAFAGSWMSAGPAPDYPRYYHDECGQVAAPGDLLLCGVMLANDGVWGHAVRAFAVGTATVRQRAAQAAVVDFHSALVADLGPGRDLNEVVAAAFARVPGLKRALGVERLDLLRLGHGLGYAYSEPATSAPFPRSYYDPASERRRVVPVPLEVGMVFEIHPICFFPGGAAGVGDMVRIGRDGPELMTAFPREITELPH